MEFKEWLRAQWDRVAAGIALAVGALALLLGWLGVRDAVFPGQQIPYIVSGGIVALFLIGAGAVLWLSADLRDEWRKLDEIDEKLGQLLARGGYEARAERPSHSEIERLRDQIDALEHPNEAINGPDPHRVSDNASRRSRRRPLNPTV